MYVIFFSLVINIKIIQANEEAGLNHADYESQNVSDENISKSEPSNEEINLSSKGRKRRSKKARKGRKSRWKESSTNGLVDCI